MDRDRLSERLKQSEIDKYRISYRLKQSIEMKIEYHIDENKVER